MTLPGDDRGWKALVRAGQPAFGRAMTAAAPDGALFERHGVIAQLSPTAPGRSVFNSVFYEDGAALLGCLEELGAAYERAGIGAWTVWVPEEDAETAAALEAAGHKLDAAPRDMATAIAELTDPDPGAGPEPLMVERYDLAAMARINEVAYGYPEGDFAPVERAPMEDLRVYFAELDGEPVSTLAIWTHGGDAVVAWVATLPEARGRGLSTRLLARALADAREAGLETTTLQATELGYPIYAKLGYRDLGAMQMWERRGDA